LRDTAIEGTVRFMDIENEVRVERQMWHIQLCKNKLQFEIHGEGEPQHHGKYNTWKEYCPCEFIGSHTWKQGYVSPVNGKLLTQFSKNVCFKHCRNCDFFSNPAF
jgi:hypothetical protein